MTLALGILLGAAFGVVIGGFLANAADLRRDLDTYEQGVLDGMTRRDEHGGWN